jgi:NAD+ diphosphatase
MRFIPSFISESAPADTDLWFVFSGDSLLVKMTATAAVVPKKSEIGGLGQQDARFHYLGILDGTGCYAIDVGENADAPEGMSFMDLRTLLGFVPDDLAGVASRAYQVLHWERTHRFCGRCGSPTQSKTDERAKVCSQCNLIIYPEISPAIIVAVKRGKEILLAHARRFPTTFYSVLAGFVEPGETFEQAVQREIMEEVGIRVKDIRYFGSQAWPFPNTIMVGFTAEYDSGEIRIEEKELTDAGWFSADNLPSIPRKGSIASRLIEAFVNKSK